MKCECGIEISKKQDLENTQIAIETNTKKIDMCGRCWNEYCNHALTGE